ncbi:pilus assembly protein TadB [Vibrio sp. 10N.286.49.B3]|uniref:type II secretion system F family protein n=1 Tax=Vibrio sp. 10N.286.49.B3 TaxID=1880855 RepID=UPI000C83CA62|nr:type II secretion system F family protein [Vibrio sp. 10N.286.49.B3]PMH46705.1 pilus assembly protein TadB [Vibrio sp. 10N.286.49.B3]
MIYWLALILGGGLLFWASRRDQKAGNHYLEEMNKTVFVDSMDTDKQAVNMQSLTAETFSQKVERYWNNILRQLGSMALIKVAIYFVVATIAANYLNRMFIQTHWLVAIIAFNILAAIWGVMWLQKREKKQFEESFPDALNMLTSAVSAGESIMHAIMFVGSSLDSEVGKEFKKMGERLQIGETPDSVFRKSCRRFPYSSFQFFVITLRANMNRGGQLKEVMTQLNRLMFMARSVEKKKFSMTSEARASVKIVAAIPFFFLFILQYLSPENFEYVMFNPSGRPILYYVICSEAIGIFIVWKLMKAVD